ncbi:MAG: hypothetical protein ACLFOY_09535 [Desulfatibacillaceae bacterium]
MRPKYFAILLAVAVVLALATFWITRHQAPRQPEIGIGTTLFPDIDINALDRLHVQSPEGTVDVYRERGEWRVKQRWGYQADFDKIAEFGKKVVDLSIGRAFVPSDKSLGRLKMHWPGSDAPAAETGTEVLLETGENEPIVHFLLGRQRTTGDMDAPDGHYLSPRGDDTVYVVGAHFAREIEQPSYWLYATLLKIEGKSVEYVASMKRENGEWTTVFAFMRPEEGKAFDRVEFPEDEKVSWSGVDRVAGALSLLELDDVKPVSDDDPGPTERYIEYRLFDGRIYRVYKGDPDQEGKCRIRLEADYEDPPAIEQDVDTAGSEADAVTPAGEGGDSTSVADGDPVAMAAKIEAWNRRFSPWIYTIAKWRCDALYTEVADVAQKPAQNDNQAPGAVRPEAFGMQPGGGMTGGGTRP